MMRRLIAGQVCGRRILWVLPSHAISPPHPRICPYDSGMLEKLLMKIAIPGLKKPRTRPSSGGTRSSSTGSTPSPSPRNRDTDLARAIAAAEAIGWKLLSQQAEGEGLQRFVSLTFRRAGA